MSKSRTSNKAEAGGGAAQRVLIHVAAPAKPAVGQACNGCGLCCASEPCPVSRLWLGHRHGPCPALTWQDEEQREQRYRCGMAVQPGRYVPWLPSALAPALARACRRWIAAGAGCDFDAEEIA